MFLFVCANPDKHKAQSEPIPQLPDSDELANESSDNFSIHTSNYETSTPSQSDNHVWSDLTHDSDITADDETNSVSPHVPISQLRASQDISKEDKYVEIPADTSDENAISDDMSDNLSEVWSPNVYRQQFSGRTIDSFESSSKSKSDNYILDLCTTSSDEIYTDPNAKNKNRKQSSER